MPSFQPFSGLRYSRSHVGSLDDVICPPYDVISEPERAALLARSPSNIVRLELPRDDERPGDRYQRAASLLDAWRDGGILHRDPVPAFYGYRMRFTDPAGATRHTVGVIGALELEPPGSGILPHEQTTPKAKTDRLELLRATRANLSPIWGLTPAAGLAACCPPPGHPAEHAVDMDGVHPRVVAHHRAGPGQERARPGGATAGAYRGRASPLRDGPGLPGGAGPERCREWGRGRRHGPHRGAWRGAADRAGHPPSASRPSGPVSTCSARWRPGSTSRRRARPIALITARMAESDALAIVTRAGTWLARPRPELTAAAPHDLDSSRLDVALAALPPHHLTYQHGWDLAAGAVESGQADAAVLLRPVTVEQIGAVGEGGVRMPAKTTFFWPKPRTGMVLRELLG